MGLKLSWAPREQNEKADALTNGNYAAFNPFRRIEVDIDKLEWRVLPDMLTAAGEIYERVRAARTSAVLGGPGGATPATKKRPPREREPR